MASREKRALAPSKSKQRANNDSSSSVAAGENSRSASKKSKSLPNPRTQLAREIFEAVATGSQLPAKIEASLPRKRALQTALKRKQKAKKTLIKVEKKLPIKTLRWIADAKRILSNKKKPAKAAAAQQLCADNSLEISESEETKKCKTVKKLKTTGKANEEAESEEKVIPKVFRKTIETSPKSTKGGKAAATASQKRNDSKERDPKVKQSLSKEPEDLKPVKTEPINDNSYEVTIEEVIASSMQIEPEVKESALQGELKGKKHLKNLTAKRSLRNGKLRQFLPKVQTDSESKKELAMAETSIESNLESKPVPLGEEKQESVDTGLVTVKVEAKDEDEVAAENHVAEADIETNNNGCENAEAGPTLRSKTKARTSDGVAGDEEAGKVVVKSENVEVPKKEKMSAKFTEMKSSSTGPGNNALKTRRSSLNIDTRRSSLYGNEVAADGGSKSQIDEMIDKIKLTIVKSIESKIYKPGSKGLILGKNFDVPKIEEIVAPLSNDATKPKLDVDAVEEKPNISKRELTTGIGSGLTKKEMKTEDAENSVPRVADTAKEIEKLVMGDIEPADSQPSKEKSEKSSEESANVVKDGEKKLVVSMKEEHEEKAGVESLDDTAKESSGKPEDTKKSTPMCPTRKSTRVTAGKSSNNTPEAKRSISAPESKKFMSSQDIVNELEKLNEDENEKMSPNEKTPDASDKREEDRIKAIKVEEQSDDEANENKTVSDADDLMEVPKDAESTASETNTGIEKMEVGESADTEKNEETLESLSREVERLVEEDDNEKTIRKVTEAADNDASSDVEMRLMIDEDASESNSEETQANSLSQLQTNNDGCDQKSSTENSDNVQKVESTIESTNSVQENSETESANAKSAATEDKSKDTAKAKSTEVEEVEEQKETRRVLRARSDKQKKIETAKSARVPTPVAQEKSETKVAISEVPSATNQENNNETGNISGNQNHTSVNETSESSDTAPVIKIEVEEQPEPQIRTRRSREVKRPPPVQVPKTKRGAKKQEAKKAEQQQQQNKEETLLDNEVAKINENDRSSTYLKTEETLRGLSANAGNTNQQKLDVPEAKNRSKSANDVRLSSVVTDILKTKKESLSAAEDSEIADADSKGTGTKDSDEASTSGESSSSVEKILETPEDRAKKEDILRQLGLESWERVKERKAKKEQQYTGTLKTIIRLQKEKEGKKRSRSPLKMVLKQQGRMDGEESFDFYTIQKEFGTSGLGDSSSGANRKLPTNPRHSCDEDNEEAPLKDRQSLVIPEKSSSFSIHPGRLCADNCCYCHTKFGSLDTPMHLAQMKSDERRKKILENEVLLNKDSCLCDACYRHVDRKANMSPTNVQLKPQRQNRQSIMRCMARNCSESARHHVKRRCLVKIKANISSQLDINWESNQHNLMTFCGTHFAIVERFLLCILCKRRLTRSYTHPLRLTNSTTEELNKRLRQQGLPATIVVNTFICRLCRYFTNLNLKNSDFESMSDNNKEFCKKYRKKLLYYHDMDVPDSEEETDSANQKNKDKNRTATTSNSNSKKSKCNSSGVKLPTSKSPDNLETPSTSTSEKSSPEPPKTEGGDSETNTKDDATTSAASDARLMGIEGAIEKLKKRKALDTTTTSRSLLNNSNDSVNKSSNSRDVVEILAMDKEVTLTRLPKRPRMSNTAPSNDITPVVQRLGANPSISVRTLFPGEEEMNLHANVEFGNVREVTPQGWEKCATMIQYDRDTKLLWQELQRPYGNQSSFLRHLVLLEKYYRSGDLILAPNASRNAINYSTSVQNRLISYEGPEKSEEPIMDSINAIEYNNSRRLSGGYMLERDHHRPSTSTSSSSSFVNVASQLSKLEPSSRVMKLTPGVSIIKKPPPNLQRLNPASGGLNGSAKRKESIPIQKGGNTTTAGGKVFQLTEPDFKRLQSLKRQKQMMNERQATSSPNSGSGSSNSPPGNYKSAPLSAQYQKAHQLAAQSQFQKHLRMQQEMLNQRSRGDFEPLICDIRTLTNENTPTQNLINNLNLPKSIQVTTKAPVATSTPISILPKIPKSLTVIPQTVARAQDK